MTQKNDLQVLHLADGSKARITRYEVALHLRSIRKFLYWTAEDSPTGEALLLVGDFGPHRILFERASAIFPNLQEKISAAGDLSGGRVMDWTSLGFGVFTPQEMKLMILEALQATDGTRREL